MRALTLLMSLFVYFSAFADQAGEIVMFDPASNKVRFHIGNVDVKPGEKLFVKNSNGKRDVTIKVISVTPPYAEGELISFSIGPAGQVERMHTGRSVALSVDKREIYLGYFMVGPSFTQKFGDFGGTNYGLGIGLAGPLPFLENLELNWSLVLQPDDLGKDAVGIGKRVSYYMFGLGQVHKNLQYFAHLGLADNMTMPPGGKKIIDPTTGGTYPDNVIHETHFGYLLSLKYYFPIGDLTRNSLLGWGIGPYASVGGAFDSSAYKPTFTIGASIEFQRVF